MSLKLAVLTLGIAHILAYTFRDCSLANECSGQTLNDSAIYFRGYKSGQNVDTTSTEDVSRIECRASHSCIESRLLSGDFFLFGVLSAFDSNISGTNIYGDKMYLLGACAAAKSQISLVNRTLVCYGDSSCRDSSMSPFTGTFYEIEAFGAYSAQNAIIHSAQTTTIKFWGYKSGYNASVICQNGHICDINCLTQSDCENMECIGGGCAITYLHSSSFTNQNVIENDAFDILTSKDEECNESGSVAYDDYREHFNGGTISATATTCCRGYTSCRFSRRISALDNTVICGGHGVALALLNTLSLKS